MYIKQILKIFFIARNSSTVETHAITDVCTDSATSTWTALKKNYNSG